jgi:hypothetical protein
VRFGREELCEGRADAAAAYDQIFHASILNFGCAAGRPLARK